MGICARNCEENAKKESNPSVFVKGAFFSLILDASSHLYKRVCPLVGRTDLPSVSPSPVFSNMEKKTK